MKAGCIANQLSEWEKIISNPETLSTVSGLPLDFSEEIDYKSSVTHESFLLKRRCFYQLKSKKLLHKGVIEECQHEARDYISAIFLTLKSDVHVE